MEEKKILKTYIMIEIRSKESIQFLIVLEDFLITHSGVSWSNPRDFISEIAVDIRCIFGMKSDKYLDSIELSNLQMYANTNGTGNVGLFWKDDEQKMAESCFLLKNKSSEIFTNEIRKNSNFWSKSFCEIAQNYIDKKMSREEALVQYVKLINESINKR